MWLSDWMDEYAIDNSEKARTVASSGSAISRLREIAEASESAAFAVPEIAPGAGVVAGRALDLSGLITCGHAECLIRQVDTLFNEIWHYFDHVVVEGPSARLFLRSGGEWDWRMEQYVELLVYLRAVGALPFLVFLEKPHALCTHHFEQSAREGGLTPLLSKRFRKKAVKEILQTASLVPLPGGEQYEFRYAGDDGVLVITAPREPDIAEVAESVFTSMATALVSDVSIARTIGQPLVQAAEIFERIHVDPVRDGSAEGIALELKLPVLRRVPTKELLRLRENHAPELIRFRSALRTAINEQSEKTPGEDATVVGARVVRDYVEPELANIERKLRIAQDTFIEKTALSVVFGMAVATVGSLAAAPLVVAAGLTAIGTTVLHGSRFVDDAARASMSDMNILWRVQSG